MLRTSLSLGPYSLRCCCRRGWRRCARARALPWLHPRREREREREVSLGSVGRYMRVLHNFEEERRGGGGGERLFWSAG